MPLSGAQVLKLISNGVPGIVSALVVGGLTVMSNAGGGGDTEKQKNVLQILQDYDSELVHVFLEVSCLRNNDKAAFTHMHRALVRLLTMEMHMSSLPEREDWPFTAFTYAMHVQEHCATLGEYTGRYDNADVLNDHLQYLVKLARDLSFNAKMNCTRAYVYKDR